MSSQKIPIFNEVYVLEKKPNRKLMQFRETWMKRDYCYNKRIKSKKYIYPENSPIKQIRNQIYDRGIPACESHLKLSNRKIAKDDDMQGRYYLKKNTKFSWLMVLDFILCFFAEAFGFSFIFIADPWIFFLISLGVTLFHMWLYDPVLALIFGIFKSLILIPSIICLFIAIIPFHYIMFFIGLIHRRNADKGVEGFKDRIQSFYGQFSTNTLTPQSILMHLYPEPLYDWSKDIPGDKTNIPKLKEYKF